MLNPDQLIKLRSQHLSPSLSISYKNHLHIVRGRGLFIEIELIKDFKSLNPARKEANKIANEMSKIGILISADGPDQNMLKIKTPIVFTSKNSDELVFKLSSIMRKKY